MNERTTKSRTPAEKLLHGLGVCRVSMYGVRVRHICSGRHTTIFYLNDKRVSKKMALEHLTQHIPNTAIVNVFGQHSVQISFPKH